MTAYKEKNFRRIAEKPEYASRRDYLEYMVMVNQGQKAKDTSKGYMTQTGTFDKFKGTYFDQTDTTISPKKHARDLNGSPVAMFANNVQLKPKIVESGLAGKAEF